MAKIIVRTAGVAAGARARNILANTAFQFADNPGPEGLVLVRVSVTSDAADNDFEVFADKDFVATENAALFAGPPRQNTDPFQEFLVSPGTQMIVDLINNGGAAVDFHTLVEYTPV